MLAKVGIDWQVEPLAPAAVAARMKALDYDLAEGGWVFIYDPDLAATGLYSPGGGFDFGRSKNDAAIALIEAGRGEVDPKKRQQIYWQLEKVLYDSYEDVWLWWEKWSPPIIRTSWGGTRSSSSNTRKRGSGRIRCGSKTARRELVPERSRQRGGRNSEIDRTGRDGGWADISACD